MHAPLGELAKERRSFAVVCASAHDARSLADGLDGGQGAVDVVDEASPLVVVVVLALDDKHVDEHDDDDDDNDCHCMHS